MRRGNEGRGRPRKAPAKGTRTRIEASEAPRLLQELRVHQLELEVQNRELRDANGVLEESRARYGELYDRAPVAHLTFDVRGRITAANVSAGTLLGVDAHRLTDRFFRTFLSLPSRRTFDGLLSRSFDSGAEMTGRIHLKPSAHSRLVDLVLAPFREPDGAVRVCHAAALDVTERAAETRRRAKLLRAARAARALAEQASGLKEHFLAVVSHELRTPLSPMLMWLQVLQEKRAASDPALRERALRGLAACVREQTALIDDLVDTARAAHGKLQLDQKPVDLANIVAGVIERASISAAAKQVTIVLQRDPGGGVVSGDADRLRQVIGNLLSNAIKFSPPGGQVELSLRATAASVHLVVRDEGEGIPADLLPVLFQPFRQREGGRARRHGGLGLGLSIARAIVVLHGGEIHAESLGPGAGARFTVALPRASGTVADQTVEPPSPPEQSAASRTALAGITVLVVDDHQPTREAVAETLQRQGAQITLAATAKEGRDCLSAGAFDVIISDLSMPEEDGYTFIRGVRRASVRARGGRRLPALALTAHAAPRQLEEALAGGFDHWLVKPVAPERLVSAVAQLVQTPARPLNHRRAAP